MSGLGRGGAGCRGQNRNQREISWMKMSTRNFPKNTYFFKVVGWICLRRVAKFTFLRFGRKTTKFGPKTTKSNKMTQNDQSLHTGP